MDIEIVKETLNFNSKKTLGVPPLRGVGLLPGSAIRLVAGPPQVAFGEGRPA
jgi:hypothetical protein